MTRAARAEQQNAGAAQESQVEVFTQRAGDGIAIGVETPGTDFIGVVPGKTAERLPFSAGVARFKADGVDGAPGFRRCVEVIHEFQREPFVRHGEIEADEPHRLCPVDGRAESVRADVQGEIPPVQAERGDAGVLHGRRGGMLDGMAKHRAVAGGGVDFDWSGCRHARSIERWPTTFKG